MLTCKQFLAELSDFLDEALGVEERKKLEDHINQCPNCWVIADTTRKTIEVYKVFAAAADSHRHPFPPDASSGAEDRLEEGLSSTRMNAN